MRIRPGTEHELREALEIRRMAACMRRPGAGVNRRGGGFRGFGGGAALAAVKAWGPGSTGYLQTAANEGIRGRAGAWSWGHAFYVSEIGGTDYLASCGSVSSMRGWHIAVTSGGDVLCRVYDGVATLRAANVGAVVVGKWNAVLMAAANGSHKGSLNGAAWVVQNSYTGYTAPDAADECRLMARESGGVAGLEFGFTSGAGGTDAAAPSDAQRDAWFVSVKAALQSGSGWVDIPSGTTHAWVAHSLTDVGSTGGEDMTDPDTVETPLVAIPVAW